MEYQETLHKASALREALTDGELPETSGVSPYAVDIPQR